jgi:opacity protein-like surface antigen
MVGNGSIKTEIGLNFGPTFFLGDLGGHRGKGTTFIKDLNLPVTKMFKGAFISFYPSEWLGFRIAAQYTYLEGRDNLITTKGEDELYRKQRNLDFKSNMFEAYAAVEIFPFMLMNRYDEEYDPRLRPYCFIGVGMFSFNPKGSITDANGNVTWHDLQPLHTEGQGFSEYPSRKPYSLNQLNIPLGGGLKYLVSERVNLGLELLYRKTFTDYIDDLSTDYIDPNLFDKYLSPARAVVAKQIHDKAFTSLIPGSPRFVPGVQRGNPKNMDAYFSFVLKCGVRLGGSPGRGSRNQLRCPSRF